MVALFVIAMIIIDIMIVGVFFARSIRGIVDSKSITGRLFWLIMTLITVVYAILFYRAVIVEYFESGFSILFYPPVITFIYWVITKCKKR